MNELIHDPDESEQEEDFSSPARESDNISRIREIIFGNEMRDFRKRLRALDRSIEDHRRETDERLTALESRINNQLELMRNEIRQGIQEIERKSAERNEELVNRYQADLRQLTDAVDSTQRDFNDRLTQFITEQADKLNELREQMHRHQEQLRSTLMEECDSLDGSKVSRYDLGDSLIALGMRLKDDTILEELSVQLLEDDEG